MKKSRFNPVYKKQQSLTEKERVYTLEEVGEWPVPVTKIWVISWRGKWAENNPDHQIQRRSKKREWLWDFSFFWGLERDGERCVYWGILISDSFEDPSLSRKRQFLLNSWRARFSRFLRIWFWVFNFFKVFLRTTQVSNGLTFSRESVLSPLSL